jgi:hypothetical protein
VTYRQIARGIPGRLRISIPISRSKLCKSMFIQRPPGTSIVCPCLVPMMLRSTLFNPKILSLELDRLCARDEGRTKDCTHARNAGLRVEERQIVAEIP